MAVAVVLLDHHPRRQRVEAAIEIAALGHGQAGARAAILGFQALQRTEFGAELGRLAAAERTRADALVDPRLAGVDVLPGALVIAVARRGGRSGEGGGGNGRDGDAQAGDHQRKLLHGDTPLSKLDRPYGRRSLWEWHVSKV